MALCFPVYIVAKILFGIKLYNLSFLRQYVTYTLSSLFHAYEAGGWISGEKRNKVRRAHGLERGYGNASI